MDTTSAIVGVAGVLLAGGGIAGLLTAGSSSRKLGAEAGKLAAEADQTVVQAIAAGWGAVVDRLEKALAKCEVQSAVLDESLQQALAGIRELRGAALDAREVALKLKERVDVIEHDQPAQHQQAVKDAVGEVVRGLGALDPAQHEEGV